MSRLARDTRASAAVEMALALPILMALFFGSVELGNYFQSQHVLVKGLRDGAVFVARQDISKFNCTTRAIDSGVVTEAKKLIQKSVLDNAADDRLPLWANTTTYEFIILSCDPNVITGKDSGGNNITQSLTGIYAANGNRVPVVRIKVSMPYRLLMSGWGLTPISLKLNAEQQAVVMGI